MSLACPSSSEGPGNRVVCKVYIHGNKRLGEDDSEPRNVADAYRSLPSLGELDIPHVSDNYQCAKDDSSENTSET